jgi:hypothetical protein
MTTANKKTVVAAALLAALFSTSSHAGLGDSLVASGGNVLITFEGTDAGYDSLISVNGGTEIFPNHGTGVGTTVDLGFFAAGTVLDISLHVLNTGNFWHTGPGAGNADGLEHANVVYNFNGDAGRTYVGFEDLFGGGDRDYNDHQFSFTNVSNPVPEPETYALMLAGLGLMGFVARRRKAA